MMTGAAIRREKNPSDDLGDVLDQLTAAHSSMVERFGKIVGKNVPPLEDPLTYAATMAQRAAAVDAALDADSKHLALMRYEWRRHERIGLLAVYLADYEAAHGDPSNVEAMRKLGADHLDLAAGLVARCGSGRRLRPAAQAAADQTWQDDEDFPPTAFELAQEVVGPDFEPLDGLPADADRRFLEAARVVIEVLESELDEDRTISWRALYYNGCVTDDDWDCHDERAESMAIHLTCYWHRLAEIDARLAGGSWPPQSREEMLSAFAAIVANQESTTRQIYSIVEQFAAEYEPTWIWEGRFHEGNLSKMRELASNLGKTANDEGARPATELTDEPDIFDSTISEETRGKAAADWATAGLDGKTGGKDGNEL